MRTDNVIIRYLDSFPLLVELLNSYFKEQKPDLPWTDQ